MSSKIKKLDKYIFSNAGIYSPINKKTVTGNVLVINGVIKDINYSLNSMIEAVESITPEGINSIEPLPIVIPSKD